MMKFVFLLIIIAAAGLNSCRVKQSPFTTQPEYDAVIENDSPDQIQLNRGGYTYLKGLNIGIKFNDVKADKYVQTSDGIKRYVIISFTITYTGNTVENNEINLNYGLNENSYKLENRQGIEIKIKNLNGNDGYYEVVLSIG